MYYNFDPFQIILDNECISIQYYARGDTIFRIGKQTLDIPSFKKALQDLDNNRFPVKLVFRNGASSITFKLRKESASDIVGFAYAKILVCFPTYFSHVRIKKDTIIKLLTVLIQES